MADPWGVFDDQGGVIKSERKQADPWGVFTPEELSAPAPPEPSSLLRRGIVDPLIGLAQGALVGIPETLVGLANIPTMGYAGKGVETITKGLGVGGFKEANQVSTNLLTPETQQAQKEVSETKGFFPTIGAALQRPSVIAQTVAQSIPAMLTGTRLTGLGMKALGYGVDAKGITAAESLRRSIIGGGIGEGAVTAGQNIEQVRQQTADQLLTPGQVGVGVASGALTGVLGVMGGKLAKMLGLEDFNTLLMGGRRGIVGDAELNVFRKAINIAVAGAREGLLEELPQSMQEQIAQNISLGKPIGEDVLEQGAMGMLAGWAQGSGAQLAGKFFGKVNPETPVQKSLKTDSLEIQGQNIINSDPDLQKMQQDIEPPPFSPVTKPDAPPKLPIFNQAGYGSEIEALTSIKAKPQGLDINNFDVTQRDGRWFVTPKTTETIPEEETVSPDYTKQATDLGIVFKGEGKDENGNPYPLFEDPQSKNTSFGVMQGETVDEALARTRTSFKAAESTPLETKGETATTPITQPAPTSEAIQAPVTEETATTEKAAPAPTSEGITRSVQGDKVQLIAKEGNKEVGEITVIPRSDGNLEVSNVLVWPEFQRKGQATKLYQQAYQEAQTQGKKLYISNDRTDDAIALHEQFRKQGILSEDGEINFTKPAPLSAAQGEQGAIRASLVGKVEKLARSLSKKNEFASIPIEGYKLTTAEQRELAKRGMTFDVDRMGKPQVRLSQETRTKELRDKVMAKHEARLKANAQSPEQIAKQKALAELPDNKAAAHIISQGHLNWASVNKAVGRKNAAMKLNNRWFNRAGIGKGLARTSGTLSLDTVADELGYGTADLNPADHLYQVLMGEYSPDNKSGTAIATMTDWQMGEAEYEQYTNKHGITDADPGEISDALAGENQGLIEGRAIEEITGEAGVTSDEQAEVSADAADVLGGLNDFFENKRIQTFKGEAETADLEGMGAAENFNLTEAPGEVGKQGEISKQTQQTEDMFGETKGEPENVQTATSWLTDAIRKSPRIPYDSLNAIAERLADDPSKNQVVPKGLRISLENVLMAEMQQNTGELGGQVTQTGSGNVGEGIFEIERPYGKLIYNEATGEISVLPAPTTSNMAAQAAKFGVDKTLLLQTLSKDIVNNDLSGTIANETIQNSLDAFISGQRDKHIDVTIKSDYSGSIEETVVTVADNGRGMTASEVKRNLLRLGAKGKSGTSTRGGYGLAKAGFLLAPRRAEITTTKQGMQTVLKGTREQFFGVKGEGDPTIETTPVGNDVPNGTTFKLYFYAQHGDAAADNSYPLPQYSARGAFDKYIDTGVFVDGVTISYLNGDYRETTPRHIVSQHPANLPQVYKKANFSIKGNDLTVYFVEDPQPPRKNWSGKYSPRLVTLNKGLALFGVQQDQYNIDNMWAEPKFRVIVDFNKTTDVQDINYPFIRNRTQMNNEIATAVSKIVNEKVKSLNEADFNLQKADFAEMVAKSPTINGIRVLIPFKDQTEFDRAAKLVSDNNSLVSDLAGIFNSFKAALSKIGGKEIDLTMTVDPKVHGYRSNPDVVGHEFYAINPFAVTGALEVNPIYRDLLKAGYDSNQAMASNLVHVLVHEYTHNTAMGEGENFTGALAQNYMKLTHGVLARLEQQARRFYEQHGTVLDSIQGDLAGMGKGGSRFQTDNINVYPARQQSTGITDRLGVQATGAGGAQGVTPPTKPPSTNQSASWLSPEDNWKADKFHKFFDRINDLEDAMPRIRAFLKKDGTILADDKDPLLIVRQYPKIRADQERRFTSEEADPMYAAMETRKTTQEEMNKYLIMRQVEQQTDLLTKRHIEAEAKRERKALDKGKKFVPIPFTDRPMHYTVKEAQDYFKNLDPKKKKDLEAISKMFDAITRKTAAVAVAGKLETQETADQWMANNPQWAPAFREGKEKDSGVYTGLGQGFTNVGSISKQRRGSEREIVNPLANGLMQRAYVIARVERNKADMALASLVKIAPNPDFWEPAVPRIEEILLTDGTMGESVDQTYKYEPNVIMARFVENGKIVEKGVKFNKDNPRALRLARSLKNADLDDLGAFLSVSAKITHYIAKINTEYSPTFGPVNFFRDLGFAMAKLTTVPELAGKQREVLRNIPGALSVIYSELRARRQGGHSTHALAQIFDQFQLDGGVGGYSAMFRSSTEMADDINKKLGELGGEKKIRQLPWKTFKSVFRWLSDFNKTLENGIRLAAYMAGINNGMTSPRAANMANELTVDFFKKGEIAQQAGALYAFFNASAQGSVNTYKVLTGPASRKIIMGGLVLGAVQAAVLAAWGFGDDEPPEFIKERNIIIPTGGKSYKTIPLPLGLHILPNLGRIFMEGTIAGIDGKPIRPIKRMANILGLLTEAFNPLGGSGISLQTLTPTPLDPLVALSENLDWNRQQISRPNFSSLSPIPGHMRAKDTASYFGMGLSRVLNLLTQGSKYTPGLFSPTPDQIDFLIGQATGGLGREATKLQHVARSLQSGDEIPAYRIPLVSRFHGTTEGNAQESTRFYNNLKKMNAHEKEITGRIGDKEPITEYLKDNPEARLWRMANRTEQSISRLMDRKRHMKERDASKESIKAMDTLITNHMRRFNEMIKGAEG
jgi:predicted GNAT family acetyltransferase